ncbi:hypothetical protein F383_34459 [Gossypium arboreum]|uniref:Uncharacterized protein n=1 Tax=Gossypium arboreum TaxID=29729 RepID=A0A0B0PT43_GOSAR|nr:hypothetical protein F383_34459 [Gossypium arboreum]
MIMRLALSLRVQIV